jgi:hypothetical protein
VDKLTINKGNGTNSLITPSVNFLLSKWIDHCKNLADNTGCQALIKAVKKHLLGKVEHVEDQNNIDMYSEIPAGKASSHGLSKWQSKHPELALDMGHKLLIHYANGRCTPEFADILALGGMVAHNVQRHWICKMNELKLNGEELSNLVEYKDQQPFWNHSYLQYLNESTKDHNLLPLFPNTTPSNEDNQLEFFVSILLPRKS